VFFFHSTYQCWDYQNPKMLYEVGFPSSESSLTELSPGGISTLED
jgi:hypothetical protein